MEENVPNSTPSLEVIRVPEKGPAKQIIYEGSKPNFEAVNSNKSLLKRLVELDLVFHGVVVILLIVVLVTVFFFNRLTPKNMQNTALQTTKSAAFPIAEEAQHKGGTSQSELYINEQVLSVDKAFNSDPGSIKLTMNGTLKKEVLGFLPYWVIDRADEINLKPLTAVSYFGIEVGADGNIEQNDPASQGIAQAWNGWQNNPKTTQFLRKLKQNRIKAFLTFKSFNNDNIEKLVRSDQSQHNFINTILYQVSSKSLDGVNIDFEYIGTPPDDVRDKFSLLMANLNKELKRQYPKAQLTIDTYPMAALETKLFDIELLANNSDGLVIMGYDFKTPQSSTAGPIAPMKSNGLNLTLAIDSYLQKVPSQKVILAVPYYGYGWPTKDASVNAEVVPGADPVTLSYAEIADFTKKLKINWNESSQTPWYSYIDPKTNQQYVVHFENVRSLGIKYDYVNTKNLEGIGIWALGLDGRNTDLSQLIIDKFAN